MYGFLELDKPSIFNQNLKIQLMKPDIEPLAANRRNIREFEDDNRCKLLPTEHCFFVRCAR